MPCPRSAPRRGARSRGRFHLGIRTARSRPPCLERRRPGDWRRASRQVTKLNIIHNGRPSPRGRQRSTARSSGLPDAILNRPVQATMSQGDLESVADQSGVPSPQGTNGAPRVTQTINPRTRRQGISGRSARRIRSTGVSWSARLLSSNKNYLETPLNRRDSRHMSRGCANRLPSSISSRRPVLCGGEVNV